MKTAVVFFSLEGNTRFVAETLKAIIGAELIELKPVKPYPTGKVSRFLSGKDAIKRATPQLEPYDFDADAYDTIVIGTPVWAGKPTPPINTFLKENDLSGKRTCFYASSSGGNAENCIAEMKAMAGADDDAPVLSIVDPGRKHSEEKMQQIQRWSIDVLGPYDSDEEWDLYDEDRNLTGGKMKRGHTVPEGAYHIVISIWLKNKDGLYLMSKRSDEKEWSPGVWETTGGAVMAGETSLEGAVREVKEELGIDLDPECGRLVRSVRSDTLQDFYDVWMFDVDVDTEDIVKQEGEVAEVKWMSAEEIDKLWQEKKLHLLLYYYKEILFEE